MVDSGGDSDASDALKTFGSVLKALRDRAGLTQEEFAERVRYSAHYVASIEQGRRFPSRELIRRGEEELGVEGVLTAAARHLTRRAGLASWFRQWAAIETDSISLYSYECRVIPGLLQSEEYARAVFRSSLPPLAEEQIEQQVTARLERQSLLVDRPNTAYSFILEQSLLARGTGGSEVTRSLLNQLLRLMDVHNVEIQVMPTKREDHAGLDGPMYLAETPEHQWIGYSEGQKSSSLITEPGSVSALLQRYGRMRAQALGREATTGLLEQMRGAL
ncbi:helix-turn-helix domain-containing protein [Streptomyces sparsus]